MSLPSSRPEAAFRARPRSRRLALSAAALSGALSVALIAGCGGGEDKTLGTDPNSQAQSLPRSDDEAHRFLVQASFGPRPEDISRVRSIGYANWINEQFAAPVMGSHLATTEAAAQLSARQPSGLDLTQSWWTHAIQDHNAQLRHRVAFALSQIFVVSTMSIDEGRAVASYLDMLTQQADGSFRDLLQAVALHPAMGHYLSQLGNRKEHSDGRVPDENFAREVMQLFSIGLHELDDAGKPKLVNGQPIDSYSADDVKGLARVFTGFSWHWPSAKSSVEWWKCFWRHADCKEDSQVVTAMSAYAKEHSGSEKTFLGVTIPAQANPDPKASLKVALDRLANHPNTAPFISRQLIQRLVSSNPSDQYVTDITREFRSTGGNLKAVVSAILLHPQARHPSNAPDTSAYGKVREPVLRLTHLLRSIPHHSAQYSNGSQSRFYRAIDSSDAGSGLGQAPMRSPSVFNFYRPGYRPPQTHIAERGLVAPEMQITTETSVLGYANFVAWILDNGWGESVGTPAARDIQFDLGIWDGKATDPQALIDAVATRVLGHHLPQEARTSAVAALQAMPSSTAKHKRQRIQAAILLAAVSPDFVVQQ